MSWLWLALASAFALATADALTKGRLAHRPAAELMFARFLFQALWLAPVLWLMPPDWPAPPFWGWLGAMVPLELLAMYSYMRAIQSSPLALTLPYLAFTPVFITVTGWVLLGERLSSTGVVGTFSVAVGAYLLNIRHLRRNGRLAWLAPLAAIFRELGSKWMLLAAIVFAFTSVMGKGALQYMAPISFAALYYVILGGVVALGFVLTQPRVFVDVGRNVGAHSWVGVFMVAMIVCHFLAIQHVEVAYMITAKRTSLLFGMIYGAVLFGEPDIRRNLLAAAFMLLGVFLVAL
ncbi:MAG: DMT family transporter [Pseudomonadota bacterium]|nr:DMT family transporter [Pseudomonadota bacterium]